MKDDILEVVDNIESIQESLKMPINERLHLECVKEFLGEMKEVLIKIAEKGN